MEIWGTGYSDLGGWHVLFVLRHLRINVVVDLTGRDDKKHKRILGLDWPCVMKSHGMAYIELPELAVNPHQSMELVRFVKDRRAFLLSPTVIFEDSIRIKVFSYLCNEIEDLVYHESLDIDEVYQALTKQRILVGDKGLVELTPIEKAKAEAKKAGKTKRKPNKKVIEDSAVLEGEAALEAWNNYHKKKKRWRKR